MSTARARSRARNLYNWHVHRPECVGILDCLDHPRWHVWLDREDGQWCVTAPIKDGEEGYVEYEDTFPTWAEAMQVATTLANRHSAPPALLPWTVPGYHYIVVSDGTMFETKDLL